MIPLLVMAHSLMIRPLGADACVASPQSVGRFCRFCARDAREVRRHFRGPALGPSGGITRLYSAPALARASSMYPAGRVHCDEFRRDELDFAGARAGKRSFSPLYVFAAGRDWRAVLFHGFAPAAARASRTAVDPGELKKNDHVLLNCGIFGVVTNVRPDSDEVTIRVDESSNTKLRITRGSIARVIVDDSSAPAESGPTG